VRIFALIVSAICVADTISFMLLLTGQRAGEIALLHHSEVSEDEIALPPERTKNARAHRIPTLLGTPSSMKRRAHSNSIASQSNSAFVPRLEASAVPSAGAVEAGQRAESLAK
jgi:hypothetical protein